MDRNGTGGNVIALTDGPAPAYPAFSYCSSASFVWRRRCPFAPLPPARPPPRPSPCKGEGEEGTRRSALLNPCRCEKCGLPRRHDRDHRPQPASIRWPTRVVSRWSAWPKPRSKRPPKPSATPCAGSKGVRAVRRTPAMNPRAAPGLHPGSESFQGGPACSRMIPLTLRRASSKVRSVNHRKARSVGPPAECNSPTPARVWPPEPG